MKKITLKIKTLMIVILCCLAGCANLTTINKGSKKGQLNWFGRTVYFYGEDGKILKNTD